MLNAFVDRIDRTGVNGWAVDSDDLSRRVPLRVLCNVNGFSEPVVAERLRPDLSGRPGMGDGRHGFALAFPPEVSAHQNLSIGIIEEASGKLLSGGYRNFPQLADSELVPIIVTAPARSGTTMLMNTLLQAPEICVAGNSPFEVMLSHYYAMAFNALTAGADPEGSTNRDDMNLERKWVGSNPFYDVGVWTRSSAREPLYRHFALEVPGTYLNTFRSAIADFYRADAGSKGKAKPNFFAEKTSGRRGQSPGSSR